MRPVPRLYTGYWMKKLLFIIAPFACLWLAACSIADWRLVHRIDVQQGNVIDQAALNQLRPGMTRRQVQFVVGSPMVADVFHQDRWDYIYRNKPGTGELEQEHLTLHFENDLLARITGTMHPESPEADGSPATREQITLVVPPEERVPPGLLSRFWHWITFRKLDDNTVN
jgi:outer membrane protein assembly factor BamE